MSGLVLMLEYTKAQAESTALHHSNGSSDTQCERGSTMGNAIC